MPKRKYPMERRHRAAQQRGFKSYGEQRRYSPQVSNRAELDRLPAPARQVRQKALDAVALARREGIDIKAAARREGVSRDAVSWWARDAVRSDRGRLVPTGGDRLYRPMYVYSDGRPHSIDVRGSKAASAVGSYHAAIQHYLHTGDPSRLARFGGKRVGGVELETDPGVIDEMARRGEFDFESIYRAVA